MNTKYDDTLDVAIEKIQSFVFSQARQILEYFMNDIHIFSTIFLITVFVLFMMIDIDKNIREIVNFFLSKYIEFILSVIYEIDVLLGKFIRSQFIETLFVGEGGGYYGNIFKCEEGLISYLLSTLSQDLQI